MKKQWLTLACAGVLSVSGILSPFSLIRAEAAPYAMEDGAYRMEDGTAIEGVFARGIDVSHWKGDIDWDAVAADDVKFVMLGTTYKDGEDPKFRKNAVEAAEAGIRVGAYLYSHATTVEMAEKEADFILDLIKDYPISYPVAFDVEENSTSGTLPPEELSRVINAFCKKIEDAGYYPLVYANDYWLANKIDLSLLEYDVWVARYGVPHIYEDPVMWQATNTGAVNGINGHVDIDFQYTDFSPHLPADQWRTIGDKTYYYQDYVMQKDTWIEDGTGWFYIGEDAQAETGWIKLDNYYYYLDDQTGRMKTGWLKQNDTWYYLDNSGIMQTGWLNLDGAYYYLDKNGAMKTGWLKDGNQDYYLSNSSGKMTVGWREVDQSWYYFDGSGAKQTGWQNVNNLWYYLNADGKMQNGWQNINNAWYYLNESGQMQTGMIRLNDQMYYLDPASGVMAADRDLTVEGINYHADASGVCTEIVAEEAPAEGTAGNGTAPENSTPETPVIDQAPTDNSSSDGTSSSGTPGNGTAVNGNQNSESQNPIGPGAFLP